ncbi:MAG: hypothetical protein JKY94_09205 [Rhodobacteraceae bacterium]|nr:hypothetical protein [Paracoccaceae bacterium]
MTKPQTLEYHSVGHITFRTRRCPKVGITFALLAGDPQSPSFEKALFTGFVEKGMGTQLRRLAHHLDELEAKLDEVEPAA